MGDFLQKEIGRSNCSWSEAVDEALCFGWIDSIKKTLDEERSIQYFSRRKNVSTWSKVNKDKVGKLILEDKMMPAGLAIIEIAKQNGSWNSLDDVEELKIPEDFAKEMNSNPGSEEFFHSLSKSVKKNVLYWITFAKRSETRQKRIKEITDDLAKQVKPKPF